MTNFKRAILATLTAVVATLGFSVGLASAHNKAVTPSCSGLVVSLTQYADDNNASHKNTYSVTIDGSVVASSADFGTTYNHTFTWDQYTDHTYTVVVTAYDGAQYGLNTSGSQTHCKNNPPKPEDKMTYTDWVSGTPACGEGTVTQTRTKSTTTYQLVDHVWVAQTPVTVTETRVVEVQITPCPTVPPTTTLPPTTTTVPDTTTTVVVDTTVPAVVVTTTTPTPPTPSPTTTPAPVIPPNVVLPATGTTSTGISILAGAFILIGGTIMLVRRKFRNA